MPSKDFSFTYVLTGKSVIGKEIAPHTIVSSLQGQLLKGSSLGPTIDVEIIGTTMHVESKGSRNVSADCIVHVTEETVAIQVTGNKKFRAGESWSSAVLWVISSLAMPLLLCCTPSAFVDSGDFEEAFQKGVQELCEELGLSITQQPPTAPGKIVSPTHTS